MERYEYAVDTFPHGKVDLRRLAKEIVENIATQLACPPQVLGGVCCLDFVTALSVEEVAVLNNVVDSHSGVPLPYEYTIDSDGTFPNRKVDLPRFTKEIQTSAIVTALDGALTIVGGNCFICFKLSLSAGDELVLESIVKAHSGEPLPASPTPVILTSTSGHAVETSSNRMLVVNFPADFGASMWLTGRGDDPNTGSRGTGPALQFTFADVVRAVPETQTIDIQFIEQFQLHDGQFFVKDPQNWDLGDEWSLCAHLEATTVVPNATNTGNCDLFDLGGYNAIVPAMGTGTHDVDLATATPIPQAGGYWNYDYFKDELTMSATPGFAEFMLLDVEVDAYMQKNVPIPFHPHGVFDFDAYDAQRLSVRWKLRLSVTKASNGPGKVAGWIVGFRAMNT
jgi:hypothetical protein